MTIQMDIDDFVDAVDDKVSYDYGLDDGGDLCFNLIENGRIKISDGVDAAAQVVAMHMTQA